MSGRRRREPEVREIPIGEYSVIECGGGRQRNVTVPRAIRDRDSIGTEPGEQVEMVLRKRSDGPDEWVIRNPAEA